MSADLPPLRVPIPAFVANWPPGLRPASVRVAGQAVRLLYVHPDAGWAEVWIHLGGQCRSGASVGFEDAVLQRLELALRARWQRDSPAADEWLTAALRHRAAVLSAAAPADAAALSAARRDADSDVARRVLLARQDRLGALDGLSAYESETDRQLTCAGLACRAFLLALAGKGAEARPLAIKAGERAVGMERAPVAQLLATLNAVHAGAACLEGGLRDGPIPMRDLAWVAGRARRPELARRAVEALLAQSPSADERRVAFAGLMAAGALDEALTCLKAQAESSPSRELFECIAEIHLWRLETDAARAFAERAGDTPIAALVHGAVDVLAGQQQAALERLTAIEGDPGVTARLWRMRALLELGRVGEAITLSRDGAYAERVAWKLWRVYADAHADPANALRGKEAYQARLLLESIHPKAVVDAAYEDDERAMQLTRLTLDRMGGNYGPMPTWFRGGSLELAEILSPRGQAIDAQLAIPEHGIDAALAALEAQATAMPSSPFPRTYHAELLLWSGHTAQARDAFAAIWEQTRTRWGYVGLGAAELYLGDPEAALAAWEAGLEHYDYLPAEATRVYRGEAYLAMDRLTEACAELEHATRASPSRVGAWIALALARLRSADPPGARSALDEAASRAPGLLAMVADEQGLDVRTADVGVMQILATAALQALGGNRASTIFTFRDRAGRFRALRSVPPEHWLKLAQQLAPLAHDLNSLSRPFG